ncbi:MAG: hypothetical protein LBJ46_10620 [Planctomycetota bacterium]|jgi:hypothetical protein|nr:hypothetical protein [Planctomycetota bacterium]
MDMVAAAEPATGGYLQLAAILAAIGLLGLFARWRKARQRPPLDVKAFRERDAEPDKYRDAADRALVELIETGREINARVDNKIRMLNRLVRDAERCIARLEKLLALADGDAAAPAALPGHPDRAGKTGETGKTEKTGQPSERPIFPESEDAGGSSRFRSTLQARVVALREEGKSSAEIAAATGLSMIEIQLALDHADRA